jgi:hypothetical protein
MRKPRQPGRNRYETQCPGCTARVKAPDVAEYQRRMAVHARNCNGLRRMARERIAEAERTE